MSEGTPTTPRLLAAGSWAAYCVSFTFLVLFEKVQFNNHSWTTMEYVLLVGSVLGAYIGGHALARRGPRRWSMLALFGSHLIVAAMSFWIFWTVPLGSATFSCPVNDAPCGVAGQIVLCAVVLGACPPLLARLSRDVAGPAGNAKVMPAMVAVLAGAGLLATGLPAASEPGWAPLGTWIAAMAGSVAVLVMMTRCPPEPAPVPRHPQPGGGLVAVRSIMMLVVAAILGFSIMLPQSNPFTFLPGLGAGVLAFGCLHLALDRALPRATPLPLALLEGGVLVVLATASFVSWWFAASGIELRLHAGIHEGITGLVLGFAWTRHASATADDPFVSLSTKGRFKGISTHGAATFWFFFLSLLVGAAALVIIWPTSDGIDLVYMVASLFCAVAIASWIATARAAVSKR